MSAWMTTATHRSALVQAALVEGIIHFDQADTLFTHMWWNNAYALHVRYNDPHPNDLEVDERTSVEAPLDPMVIINSVGCFDYQCAEYEGYNKRWDMDVMYDLRDSLLAKHGLTLDEFYERKRPGSMPWGIDNWEQVIDRRTAPA